LETTTAAAFWEQDEGGAVRLVGERTGDSNGSERIGLARWEEEEEEAGTEDTGGGGDTEAGDAEEEEEDMVQGSPNRMTPGSRRRTL
jgi:hypothetical protein